MPYLVVDLENHKRATPLPARVLIGRRSMNHLVIDHRTVSRMHAWIDGADGRYFITDAGSRTGTRINGVSIADRSPLRDGDVIGIGPARLVFRAGGEALAGIETFDLSAQPVLSDQDKGILFSCSCGAPLWAAESYYGHSGNCRYCGKPVSVPFPSGDIRGPAAPPVNGQLRTVQHVHLNRADEHTRVEVPIAPPRQVAEEEAEGAGGGVRAEPMCGVCHSPITSFEERAACPSCGLTFHAECWAENFGCSAYGCPQVNALKPPEEATTATGMPLLDSATVDPAAANDVVAPAARFPWEFLLLAGSVFGALLSAVSFGVPSLAMAGGSAVFLVTHRGRQRTGVVLLAVALGLLGLIAGVIVSYLLYVATRAR